MAIQTEPYIMDGTLARVQERAQRLVLLSGVPDDYNEATSTPSSGGKSLAIRDPASGEFSTLDGTPAGSRRLSISIVTGPNGQASGTATHWAALNTTDGKVLTKPAALPTPITITQGNPVDWPRLEIINDDFA